jgi:hypothetical protein
MATPNYNINYDDKRFTQVESDKKEALTENEKLYDGMIANSDKYFQAQIEASKEAAEKQEEIQQQQTDFAIEKIEQQKEQAQKDYIKEQSGAYVDWQKQSDQYGANAEKVAAQGLQNTGYSESSQVRMYTAYQNRVAVARDAISRAMLTFDNNIKEAQLQNNSILAEIYAKAQDEQLELALQGFQYKNTLILDKADKKTQIENTYYARYQDVLAQINHENALAEQVRQYNETLAEQKRQHSASIAQQKAALAEEKRQFDILHPAGGGTSTGNSSSKAYKEAKNEHIAYKKATTEQKKADSEKSAYEYLNALIASGATKDKVSNEIAIALREGEITKAQATKLRNTFTPRGVAY